MKKKWKLALLVTLSSAPAVPRETLPLDVRVVDQQRYIAKALLGDCRQRVQRPHIGAHRQRFTTHLADISRCLSSQAAIPADKAQSRVHRQDSCWVRRDRRPR